jgi:hypothetical protein
MTPQRRQAALSTLNLPVGKKTISAMPPNIRESQSHAKQTPSAAQKTVCPQAKTIAVARASRHGSG